MVEKPIKKSIPVPKNIGTKSGNKTTEADRKVIDLNSQSASVFGSGVNISAPVYILGLVLIVGIGIVSFLLIRKRKSADGKIRAEDITIVE